MKKSSILFTVLVVTAFLVATVLGLQNPNVHEGQNELPESIESPKDATISNNSPEDNGLTVAVDCSSLKT